MTHTDRIIDCVLAHRAWLDAQDVTEISVQIMLRLVPEPRGEINIQIRNPEE